MTVNNINIYFSHQVEQLATQLTGNLMAQVKRLNNPLEPVDVIVPNANMQRYLQLHVAESQGICANIEFPFLENGLSQYLNLFEADKEPELWTQSALAIKIFAQLADETMMQEPVMKPIHGYLSSHEEPRLLSSKRWQLSQRLAVLFINYELQRPEMVVQWLQNQWVFKGCNNPVLHEIEAAQKHLYLKVMTSDQGAAKQSLFQRFKCIDWNQLQPTTAAMHLFTPTRLSAFHRHLLGHMAKFLDVHIYQLNVCCEYWEDLTTEREDAWIARVNAIPLQSFDAAGQALTSNELSSEPEAFTEIDDSMVENPLLKAWAKPGRESLRLFSQLEDDALHLDVVFSHQWLGEQSNRGQHALHVIQDGILYRQQHDKVLQDVSQLLSLQLARAPSIQREVEAVYNNVLWNLQQDPDLKLSDVAILVTDMEKYRFVIEQVFTEQNQQHPFDLSYSLIDSNVKTESLFAQGVLGLFEVLEQDYMRGAVFKWLANDCVKQALELSEDDIDEWLRWARHLGIFSGFDQLYQAPNQPELSQRFTWQQGLKRLRQSMVSDRSEEVSQDIALIGHVTWVLENLHQWQLKLQQPMKASQWQPLLKQLTSTFLAIPDDSHREEQVQLACHQAIETLVEHAGEVTMSLADIRCYLEQSFTHLSASKGNYLSGGLICASLQPMRPIPFQVTYVLGLDEHSFPGELYQEALDLTQRSRKLGDLNKIENMNYLLLETLMCTRNKLYLSYVGQNLLKDEVIMPASTWQQLHDQASSLLGDLVSDLMSEQVGYPVVEIPLDSAAMTAASEQPEYSDWLMNFAASDQLKAQLRFENLTATARQINSADTDVDYEGEEAFIPIPVEGQQLEIQNLAKFLENPLLSYVNQVGASSQLVDDQVNIEHEPFKLDGLSRYQLFDAAMDDYLQALEQGTDANLRHSIDQRYEALAKQSQLPIELFAELPALYALEAHKSFASLKQKLQELKALSGPVVFGAGNNQHTPAQRAMALNFSANGQNIQLQGSWEGLYRNAAGLISDQVVVSSVESVKWSKYLLKPFLFWCMAQLDEEVKVAEAFHLHVVFRNQVSSHTFKPWSLGDVHFTTASQIQAYLVQMVVEYEQAAPVNLPFDTVKNLKVSTADREPMIPYLAPNSKAKSNHAFAYDEHCFNEEDHEFLQKTYAEKANDWLAAHSYYELLQAIEVAQHPDALSAYRRRLLPLHVMVEAKLP